ncbi:MAG: flagellar biosynthesis anti-sigma factor FlgM [Fimbriimonadaceae bacterium]|nr:flagellar biosynthesis anti-sigma factor FlgM [Fimbriimonadaceae bacterium]
MKKVVARRKEQGQTQDSILGLREGTGESSGDIVARLTKRIANMPEREELVAELKARIEAGTYNPTGEEIADAMIRRAIADEYSL